jgi:short-subunit dehydrogenase
MEIRGTSILLTGATGGLGRAVARDLDRKGARLVLTGRDEDAVIELASELDDAEAVVCDLADRAELERLAMRASDVDVVISNAALPASGTLDEFTAHELDRALDVNLRAPMVLARAALPPMVERRRGHLVFVSSMSGRLPSPYLSVYAATKWALRGFAASLRLELTGTGVGVSAVFPGAIADAGMFAEAGVQLPRMVGSRRSSAVAQAITEAIVANRGELAVASTMTRAAALFYALAPQTFCWLSQHRRALDFAARLAAAQRHNR